MGSYAAFDRELHGAEWDQMEKCAKTVVTAADAAADDDNARVWVAQSSCANIASAGAATLEKVIAAMISGFTGEEDQVAIVSIFNCLQKENKCDVMRQVVQRDGSNLQDIIYDTDAANQKNLKGHLDKCGVVTLTDDDATRAYIGRKTSEELGKLSLLNVIQLLRNMIVGFTGDDDSRMILKLWLSRTDAERLKIQRKQVHGQGILYEEFKSDVNSPYFEQMNLVKPQNCLIHSGRKFVDLGTGGCECTCSWCWSCDTDSECKTHSSCSNRGGTCRIDLRGRNECKCMRSLTGSEFCQKDPPTAVFLEQGASSVPSWVNRKLKTKLR